MHVVLDEYERRIADGRVLQGVTEEARALEEWFAAFRKGHPDLPALKAKTIKNNISARHRSLGAKCKNARN